MSVGRGKRFAVLHRDSFTCRYCGRSAPDVALEADHILPRSHGGDDAMDNLVTACFDCNRGKQANFDTREPLDMAAQLRDLLAEIGWWVDHSNDVYRQAMETIDYLIAERDARE